MTTTCGGVGRASLSGFRVWVLFRASTDRSWGVSTGLGGRGARKEGAGGNPQGILIKGRKLRFSGSKKLDHDLVDFIPISFPQHPGLILPTMNFQPGVRVYGNGFGLWSCLATAAAQLETAKAGGWHPGVGTLDKAAFTEPIDFLERTST